MATVRAKVKCTSIKESMGSRQATDSEGKQTWVPCRQWSYEFAFVSKADGGEENAKFWEHSPSGALNLTAIKERLYEVGRFYYLDWTPAP